MPEPSTQPAEIESVVAESLCGEEPLLLAVSGGLDSMCLLTGAVRALGPRRISVATFDHGTGDAAVAAARLVCQRGDELGVVVVAGRATGVIARSEESWRDARWAFLRTEASLRGAVLVTAHTQDDQIETVLMRLLRGSGVRGLAALEARSGIRRPLLRFSRQALVTYAAGKGLRWSEDPSNTSPTFLRNRVRHDLLPALRRGSPGIDEVLLTLGRTAAAWRAEVEDLVAQSFTVVTAPSESRLDVRAADLEGHAEESLRIVWPVLLQRIGVIADRRAIARLAEFTQGARQGSRMQIAGGWQVQRSGTFFHVRPLRSR